VGPAEGEAVGLAVGEADGLDDGVGPGGIVTVKLAVTGACVQLGPVDVTCT